MEMNNCEAIAELKKRLNRYHPTDGITIATRAAIAALTAQDERQKGCVGCIHEADMPSAAECHGCSRMFHDRYAPAKI